MEKPGCIDNFDEARTESHQVKSLKQSEILKRRDLNDLYPF